MVLHKTGTLDPSGCPGSIPGVGVGNRSSIPPGTRTSGEVPGVGVHATLRQLNLSII